MKKRNLMRILTVALSAITLFCGSLLFTSCGLGRDELNRDEIIEKLNEVEDGVSLREALVNDCGKYDYIELSIKHYDTETQAITKKETIFIHNILDTKEAKIDLSIYKKVEEGDNIRYDFLRKEDSDGYNHYITLVEDDITEKYPKVYRSDAYFKNELNTIFSTYYRADMLPQGAETIISGFKKTLSTDVNRMQSYEVTFKDAVGNPYEVTFNYNTKKIHFFKELDQAMNVKTVVEYTYPGNLVTKPQEPKYSDIFDLKSPVLREAFVFEEAGEYILDKYLILGDHNKEGIPAVLVSGEGVKLTINNGIYYGGYNGVTNTVVVQNGASVVINEGIFTVGTTHTGEVNRTIKVSSGSSVEINGGFFTNEVLGNIFDIEDGAELLIKGGCFVNYNPEEHIPQGYTVDKLTRPNGDSWFEVVKVPNYVAPEVPEDSSSEDSSVEDSSVEDSTVDSSVEDSTVDSSIEESIDSTVDTESSVPEDSTNEESTESSVEE
jgi:hypothetical protein